jgi:hypothetical protein
MEDAFLDALRDCLFSVFAAALQEDARVRADAYCDCGFE